MQIELPYGGTTMTAELPAGTRMLSNVERAGLPPVDDLDAAVRAALATPHGLPRIGALVRPGSPVTIAFDDQTTGSFGPIRPTAIRAVLDELEAAGVSPRDVTLICANALHRMLRPAELARLIGDDLVREIRAPAHLPRRRGPRADRRPRGHGRARIPRRGAPPRRRVGPHRVRQDQLHPRLHRRLEVGVRRALHVADDSRDAHAGRHVDVRASKSHARRPRRDGTPLGGAPGQAHLQDRHAARGSPSRGPHVRGRRGRDAARGTRGAGRALSAAPRGERRAGRRARLRCPGLEPVRDLRLGQSDPDPGLVRPRLSRRHDRSGGQARLHGDHGRAGPRHLGPRRASVLRGGLGAHPAPDARSVRDHRTLRGRSRAASRVRRAYRRRYAFHPIHGILATHPLKRLRHVGRVIVAAPEAPHVPRHLGFEVAASVEAAVAEAKRIHGRGATIAYVEQAGLAPPA